MMDKFNTLIQYLFLRFYHLSAWKLHIVREINILESRILVVNGRVKDIIIIISMAKVLIVSFKF